MGAPSHLLAPPLSPPSVYHLTPPELGGWAKSWGPELPEPPYFKPCRLPKHLFRSGRYRFQKTGVKALGEVRDAGGRVTNPLGQPVWSSPLHNGRVVALHVCAKYITPQYLLKAETIITHFAVVYRFVHRVYGGPVSIQYIITRLDHANTSANVLVKRMDTKYNNRVLTWARRGQAWSDRQYPGYIQVNWLLDIVLHDCIPGVPYWLQICA